MDGSVRYSVVGTGQTLPDFDADDVIASLALMFKIDDERARSYLGKPRIIKKNLDQKTADVYKAKLEKIGLAIVLKKSATQAKSGLESLALEPIEGEVSPAQSEALAMQAKPPGVVACPKCGHEQLPRELCDNCGIYLNKMLSKTEAQAELVSESSKNETTVDATEFAGPILRSGLTPIALGVGAVAALCGAWLWYFIAVQFDYELGIIAWVIGGVIGFSVAVTGARGDNVGIACGALALVAIIGGKYMTMASIQTQLGDVFANELPAEMLTMAYEEETRLANVYFEEVFNDASMLQFMLDYGYSLALSVDQIEQEEIINFEDYSVPRFKALMDGEMSYEEWLSSQQMLFDDLSTFELTTQNLGWLDIVFLFLGVGTAYRLGRGE